ncbi:hypothetical protein [Acidianus sp. HS-5]|uniref:hypothetical protein n=1 Tax=Acidianus sp. HS-5 TaxID=2886040 RepID=UPI001F2A0147|nr:hypothetical protein [Acidianus sp. HS-5]BDC17915.1 hypothetical protein HS5_08050 [Acidianus sp. HS-5]
MSEDNPDKLNELLNSRKDLIDKFINMQKENLKEIKGDNWKVESYELRIDKGSGEEASRIFGISFNNVGVGISVSEDGKLKHLAIFSTKDEDESEEVRKRTAQSLILFLNKNKVLYQEAELELLKGKTGPQAIKSIRIIKNEEYSL